MVVAVTEEKGKDTRKFITAFLEFDFREVVSFIPWIGTTQIVQEVGAAVAEAGAEAVIEETIESKIYQSEKEREASIRYLIENE